MNITREPALWGRCTVCEVSLKDWPLGDRAWDVCAACAMAFNLLGRIQRAAVRFLVGIRCRRGAAQ